MNTLINDSNKKISRGDKIILDIVNKDPLNFIDISIVDFGKRTNSTTSTISKFVRHLGFENYKTFQHYISKSFYIMKESELTDPQLEETRDIITNKNYAFYAIDQTARIIDNPETQKLVDCIISSKKVWCIGMGNSFLAARDLSSSLNTQGIVSFATNDIFGEIRRLQQVTEEDLIIIISERLGQKEYEKLIDMASKRGVKIATITSINPFFINDKVDYKISFFAFPRETRPDVVRNTKMQQIFVNNFIISSLIRKKGIDLSKQDKIIWER
ncbi:RpiR family transcriptional regulator [Williamsoniiplasma luminosum]|uniref:RpiR family transcriptional regulator n=1 Tax=Williamsoniiplasma luminosum TaxID=214888 RepID=A0A2K8NVD0_9MOLU|nr:MurR/RpiR family transcriptional regulator [Williamsoniiplasma luminosum]ATZ17128.1 RpiR family transcriptional regulator [Williamsoniiplasma luminosum]